MGWLRASVFSLGLAGCSPTVTSADSYSHSCSTSADCVIVSVGDQCAACAGVFTSISAGELDRLIEDSQAAADACPPWSERFHVDCLQILPETQPDCTDGVCTIPATGNPCTFSDGFCHGADQQ